MSDPRPLIGDHLAIDLINTRTWSADLLSLPGQLDDWVALQHALEHLAGRHHDLAAVRSVRDHAASALARVREDRPPRPADRAALHDAQRAAPAITLLRTHDGLVSAQPGRLGPEKLHLAGALAQAACELLADPSVATIRECAAGDCVMLFRAPNPRRIWCSPSRCGNRTRVARHYARRATS